LLWDKRTMLLIKYNNIISILKQKKPKEINYSFGFCGIIVIILACCCVVLIRR